MRPEKKSKLLLGVTRSKAKMYEYDVPEDFHIKITRNPNRLFTLSIGLLGELASRINSGDTDQEVLDQLRKDLQFSAEFFDNYIQSKLDQGIEPYLILLGSAAYYLCDLPGSSLVLINQFGERYSVLEGMGLEKLLFWLLKGDFTRYEEPEEVHYTKLITKIMRQLSNYSSLGTDKRTLFTCVAELRVEAYTYGTPRQLLLTDIIGALIKKRCENSTWHCLPYYSDLAVSKWSNILKKPNFIAELWPSQHLLGSHGVFKGKSAVVQMPTSAGKTKATEIIIRSAFLSGRTSLAIVVAPFRALCHEIRDSFKSAFKEESIKVDELSDILQADFDVDDLFGIKRIIVTTPEKLIYVIRRNPELAESMGLLILDEGHQFDSGTRGVTYELLIASLKMMVPQHTQTVLISAVISNAEAINNWLNGVHGEVVSGANLVPTHRTVAFTSWLDQLGRLEFVDHENLDQSEFYVPRVMEQYELQLKGRERSRRLFPDRSDGRTISLYLGLKLVRNGGVAIFCGTKGTTIGLCEKIIDVYSRGLPLTPPVEFSNKQEIEKLHYLYERNLGSDSYATHCAGIGVLAHHANVPHGIRLAVEYALKEGLGKFVICTSTLAQGVNLPIRYLIVSSVYQGRDRIRVRDFHNLIGRAGRSGIYTEGSILFADPTIYDKRKVWSHRWRWEQVEELLNPKNSEPCISTLFSVFQPLKNDDGDRYIKMSPLDFANTYINNPKALEIMVDKIVSRYSSEHFTIAGLQFQINWKINIISAIESYLMAHLDDRELGIDENDVSTLAKGTLAYSLAEEEQRENLIELFKILAFNINSKVASTPKRKIFGRTLYGLRDCIAIENWVSQNIDIIMGCRDQEELLRVLWPLIGDFIQNNTFNKCNKRDALLEITIGWINGQPFNELLQTLVNAEARIGDGERPRTPTIDHIVDICENALAFDGTVIIGAVAELIMLIQPVDSTITSYLLELQKRMKYGLPASSAIILFEIGFSDRVIAIELSKIIKSKRKKQVIRSINRQLGKILEVLDFYPSYYNNRLNYILKI